MRCLRRGLVLVLVAAALAAGGATAASGPAPVHLPRDHYPHPAAGVEWWYVTGVVRGSDGDRYTIFFTLFRRGGFVLPISQVVDLGRDAIVGHSEKLGQAALHPAALDVRAAGAALRYDQETNAWSFAASDGGYTLSFAASPEKPYALHGTGGVIHQSLGGSSAYYSATRMSASGSFTTATRRVAFTGTAWLDHQWGSFENDPRAFNWDWFSCRFDDRTELMLYRFRDRRTGAPLAAYASGTYVARDGTTRRVAAFTASHDGRTLHAAGRDWPLDWRLTVLAPRLDVRLRSLARNQLFRGILVSTFFEGAAAATGSRRGTCFVEETYR